MIYDLFIKIRTPYVVRCTSNLHGFTIIELLISIAIVVILGSATSIPFASRFINRNNVETKTNEVVSAFRTAQLNSISGKGHSSWGVHIDTTKIVMFKGISYVFPGTVFDQKYSIPSTVSITPVDVVFDELTGSPSAVLTVTIQNSLFENHIVRVNEVGSVNLD
jgi:prepilin-type N-terminal cleavage/methylation domain-containing protein